MLRSAILFSLFWTAVSVVNVTSEAELAAAVQLSSTTVQLLADITVSSTVTINDVQGLVLDGGASRHKIDGNGAVRCIYVDAVELTLVDLTITNCAYDDGGGLRLDAGTITMIRCIVSLCSAPGAGNHANGGGVYVGSPAGYAVTVNVLNCEFRDNTATYWGGGLYAYKGTISISATIFSGNRAFVAGNDIYYSVSNSPVLTCTPGCGTAGEFFANGSCSHPVAPDCFDGSVYACPTSCAFTSCANSSSPSFSECAVCAANEWCDNSACSEDGCEPCPPGTSIEDDGTDASLHASLASCLASPSPTLPPTPEPSPTPTASLGPSPNPTHAPSPSPTPAPTSAGLRVLRPPPDDYGDSSSRGETAPAPALGAPLATPQARTASRATAAAAAAAAATATVAVQGDTLAVVWASVGVSEQECAQVELQLLQDDASVSSTLPSYCPNSLTSSNSSYDWVVDAPEGGGYSVRVACLQNSAAAGVSGHFDVVAGDDPTSADDDGSGGGGDDGDDGSASSPLTLLELGQTASLFLLGLLVGVFVGLWGLVSWAAHVRELFVTRVDVFYRTSHIVLAAYNAAVDANFCLATAGACGWGSGLGLAAASSLCGPWLANAGVVALVLASQKKAGNVDGEAFVRRRLLSGLVLLGGLSDPCLLVLFPWKRADYVDRFPSRGAHAAAHAAVAFEMVVQVALQLFVLLADDCRSSSSSSSVEGGGGSSDVATILALASSCFHLAFFAVTKALSCCLVDGIHPAAAPGADDDDKAEALLTGSFESTTAEALQYEAPTEAGGNESYPGSQTSPLTDIEPKAE